MKYFKLCLLLCMAIALAACIDLSGSHHKLTKTSYTHSKYSGEVYTMRGGLGIFSIGMNQLSKSVEERFHVSAPSTMWYNAGAESRTIIENWRLHKRPIVLIGHSLGANDQIKVARNLEKAGIPVALLVTVDAVSQTVVPSNVIHALNFYKPGFVPMFSGLRLRAVNPKATKIDNINVDTLKGVQVNHFTIDKDKQVQSKILAEIEKVLTHAVRKDA